MKHVFTILGGLTLSVGLVGLAGAADTSMTGMISDSMCGASHAKMTSSHKGMTDRDCALACVKAGAKYVFVSNGKVYNISNQNEAGLSKYAGENAKVTADFSGSTITISKIAAEK
jgi:hypothetical protein